MTRNPGHGEAGFTLIELLIASTAGLILLFVVAGMAMDAFRMANLLKARVALNQEARVAFELLSFGGGQTGLNNAPATQNYTFGLLGRRSAGAAGTGWAAPADLMAKNGTGTRLYQLALSANDGAPDPAPAGSLVGPLIPSFEINCTGVSDPVAGCAASTTVTMIGRVRSDPTIIADGRLREITVRFLDPYILGNRFGALGDAIITFWTVLPLNIDEHPT